MTSSTLLLCDHMIRKWLVGSWLATHKYDLNSISEQRYFEVLQAKTRNLQIIISCNPIKTNPEKLQAQRDK